MKNEIGKTIPALLTQAEDCADGAAQYGAALGLFHNTEAAVREDINDLLGERNGHVSSRVVMADMRRTLETRIKEARAFLTMARDILKPQLGRSYSEAWDPTGFTGSLAVPFNAGKLQSMLQLMHQFLASNETMQKAELNITAARAGVLFNELSEARSAIHAQRTQVRNMINSRDEKAENLRKRIRGLIKELGQMLTPLDPRWLAFGLNMPGAQETPEAPLNVTAVLIGPNAVAVKWSAAARAEYYRVWMRLGDAEDWESAGSPADLDFTIEGLPSSTPVQIAVSAVNNGGESGLSEVATVTTQMLQAA